MQPIHVKVTQWYRLMSDRILQRRQRCYKQLIQTDLPMEFVYAYCTEWAEGDEEELNVPKNPKVVNRVPKR